MKQAPLQVSIRLSFCPRPYVTGGFGKDGACFGVGGRACDRGVRRAVAYLFCRYVRVYFSQRLMLAVFGRVSICAVLRENVKMHFRVG